MAYQLILMMIVWDKQWPTCCCLSIRHGIGIFHGYVRLPETDFCGSVAWCQTDLHRKFPMVGQGFSWILVTIWCQNCKLSGLFFQRFHENL